MQAVKFSSYTQSSQDLSPNVSPFKPVFSADATFYIIKLVKFISLKFFSFACHLYLILSKYLDTQSRYLLYSKTLKLYIWWKFNSHTTTLWSIILKNEKIFEHDFMRRNNVWKQTSLYFCLFSTFHLTNKVRDLL